MNKKVFNLKILGEICEVVGGGTPKSGLCDYWGSEIVWITPKDLGKLKSRVILDSEKRISSLGLKKSSARLLPRGSVVLSSRAPIGHVAIAGIELATNQGCRNFICGKEIYNKYLYYFLFANKEYLNSLGEGSTFKEVSGTKLKEVLIPLPPLPEQHRIVKILDEVFADVARVKKNAERNLQNAKELFESYLQSVFSYPGEDWEEKRLGEAYDVRDGTHDSPKYQKEGYALITSKNLKRDELDYQKIKYISEKDYKKINERSKVHKGDILFAMIGTIGNPVVIKAEPDFAIKNVALFKIPKEQNSYFLKYFLDSKFVIDKMMSEANGTTQKFVGLGYLRNFKIQLPKLDEQKSIVAKLDSLSAETKKLEAIFKQKLADLEELKKSVLKKAFAGEL